MAKHWTALGFTKAEAAVARGYILDRTDRNFDCWIWLLSTNKGHGQTVYHQSAHRVSYAAFVGRYHQTGVSGISAVAAALGAATLSTLNSARTPRTWRTRRGMGFDCPPPERSTARRY
jgi:hypothetical protein